MVCFLKAKDVENLQFRDVLCLETDPNHMSLYLDSMTSSLLGVKTYLPGTCESRRKDHNALIC